jgi:hypothetical protein
MPTDKDTMITIRLEGIKQALTRSRIAFLVETVICLAVLLGIWNSYFSWDRAFAQQTSWADEKHPVTRYLQQRLVDEWVKNQQISSQLVGIHVSTSDATFLASLALTITSIWFFWCTRRENHSIGSLLRDTRNDDSATKLLVFHGVQTNLVFVYLTHDDAPIRSLTAAIPPVGPLQWARGAVRALSFLPTFTILSAGLIQFYYLYQPSPFHPKLPFVKPHTYHWSYVGFVALVSLAAALITAVVASKINQFQDGVAEVMREYFKTIDGSANQKTNGTEQKLESITTRPVQSQH